MPEAVPWRYDATNQPWLRALLLVAAGLLYGLLLLFAASAAFVLGLVAWRGSWEVRLLVGLFALVGGPLSLLYLLPMLRDPEQRPTFYPAAVEPPIPTRTQLVAAVAGAALLALAGWVAVPLAVALVAVGGLAGLGYLLAATRGHVGSDTATLALGPREFDLSRVAGYRTRQLGPLALVTLSVPARPGRFGSVPSRFTVPVDRLDDVTAALDAVVAATDTEEPEGRDPNPVVQAVAVTLALVFVGAGVGGVALVGSGVGWYVAALCWLFAVIFLYVAREG